MLWSVLTLSRHFCLLLASNALKNLGKCFYSKGIWVKLQSRKKIIRFKNVLKFKGTALI